MNNTEKIRQAVTNFVKGGDNIDVKLLSAVLHDDLRVTSNYRHKIGVITAH